jgi:hypothetical protein
MTAKHVKQFGVFTCTQETNQPENTFLTRCLMFTMFGLKLQLVATRSSPPPPPPKWKALEEKWALYGRRND